MKLAAIAPAIALLIAGAGPHAEDPRVRALVEAQTPAAGFAVRFERGRQIAMRDGVPLSTDLYFPDGETKRLPVILIRTPYGKQRQKAVAEFFAGHGYAVAVQDLRGKFESAGRFFPYSAQEREDGYDTVDWLARQDWSAGKIGTFGCSYVGEVQYLLAATRHPAHATGIMQSGSAFAGGNVTNFGFMRQGITELAAAFAWNRSWGSTLNYAPPPWADRAAWFASDAASLYSPVPSPPAIDLMKALDTLPVRDMMARASAPPSAFDRWLSEPPESEYWRGQGGITSMDRFDVPTLHINSWYDLTPTSTLRLFELFRKNSVSARARHGQYLIMAPGTHCAFESAEAQTMVGERDVGDARLNFRALYLAWFDHWLKGAANDVAAMPHVLNYVMGRGTWRAESGWPVAGMTETRYYLRAGGGLSVRQPSRNEPADSYRYDPMNPAPSLGGTCCTGGEKSLDGALDQRPLLARKDVLLFAGERLARGVEVTGEVFADLHVRSSAPDTDFIVKLVDIYPDGRMFNVLEGAARMRYRDGLSRRAPPMRQGGVYRLRVDMEATSNYFAPGHRIGVLVTSSSHPRFARNLNTGGDNFSEAKGVTALNSVLHDSRYPSSIILPVVAERRGSGRSR